METTPRALKRPRLMEHPPRPTSEEIDLKSLISSRNWVAVTERVLNDPKEAATSKDPSPLALVCRLGAPFACVQAVLKACPSKVRHLLDSRGTPLHEAVVCDEAGPEVINLLLKVDEDLGSQSPRAAIMQDVDGYTPLHLLIRRRFQSHILGADEGSHLMELLEMLVKSCAEAVIVPDRGEYEEPPIVMALKANVYSPLLQSEEGTVARIERNISEMVQCMLEHYPAAASCVFSGYRGNYTALHSAVFHGRCPDTLELLLQAEKRSPSAQRVCMLANTQGEMPLHFCAMRGEPPRSIALLAEAAPEVVSQRDASGLTPFHWLWIRFISSLLAIDDGGRGTTVSVTVPGLAQRTSLSEYLAFASLELGDFETDLHLVRRLDASVDFLRMRHIPSEAVDGTEAVYWAERTAELLNDVRERYHKVLKTNTSDEMEWTRLEAVAGFFWTKVVSLLKALSVTRPNDNSEFSLTQTAFQSISCPPPVARIVATLFPEEMSTVDADGRLPLHHASRRPWHAWDWPREDGTTDAANAQILQLEAISLLKTALVFSPPDAAKRKDKFNCLPIHYAIPTVVRALCTSGRSCSEHPVAEILGLCRTFVKMNPDSLNECDPYTGLYPFLKASAVAADCKKNRCSSGSFPDHFSVSIVYDLLRENPSLVKTGLD